MAARLALSLLACAAVAAALPPRLAAQAEPAAVAQASPSLREELEAMAKARLLSLDSASVEQLRALTAEGEKLSLAGRHDQAVLVLLEALESPRYADFADFPEYAAAEHMAAVALMRLGSLLSAKRYLERAIARGQQSPYYGPAVRRFSDVMLLLGTPAQGADFLARQRPRSEEAENELLYLRARAHYDAGEDAPAAALLARIGKRSRFHGNAQYLLGVISTRQKRMRAAEQHFCAVAGTGVEDVYSFYVDDRFFEVQDLARLALGRTAHETRRGDDAFYYYFQVPRDSPRLPESLFEAAYASYESDEHDTALDLLEQLEAHYPDSAFVDEAAILRGYVALARCDFERADRYFTAFNSQFTPLLAHIDRLLANRARREQLYEALLTKEGHTPANQLERTLFGLLRVDPEFYRLHEQVRALDAEAARASRVADAFAVVHARLLGSDRPRAAAAAESEAGDALDALVENIERAELSTRALSDDLDALRRAGAKPKSLDPNERELARIAEKLHDLKTRARLLRAAPKLAAAVGNRGKPLPELVQRDAELTRMLPARVEAVRAKLVRAASARAELALRDLRDRLANLLRRARIGRIDAVMGSKRRVELQIESLAAGRFPAELRDPLRVQGLLADDEEYWPFEGEDWPDEYQENYRGDEGAGEESP